MPVRRPARFAQDRAGHLQPGDSLAQGLGEDLGDALRPVQDDELVDRAERLGGRFDDRGPVLGELLADDRVLVLGKRVGRALMLSASAMPLARTASPSARPLAWVAAASARPTALTDSAWAANDSRTCSASAAAATRTRSASAAASSFTRCAFAPACSSTSFACASAAAMRASRDPLASVVCSYALASAGLRTVAWRRCSSR